MKIKIGSEMLTLIEAAIVIGLAIGAVLLLMLLGAFILSWAWGAVMVAVFGLPTISTFEAFALLVVISAVSRFFRRG